MKTQDFLQELKKLDSRLDIIPNKNRTAQGQKFGQGISNIMLGGRDVCAIPSDDIKETFDPHYYYVFPNGAMSPFTSKEDALKRVQKILDLVSTKEGDEEFFAKDDE